MAYMYHALLIGIDTYHEKPLHGAARDAREIRRFLENEYPSTSITSLVASHYSDTTTPTESKPTWSNVTNTLWNLAARVSSGDSVYIHFSGHGCCCERNRAIHNTSSEFQTFNRHVTSAEEQVLADSSYSQSERVAPHNQTLSSSNVSTNDLALVLLADNEDNQDEYLFGYDIAMKLKEMVDNGALVTMTLDCCYSGSVVRDDKFDAVSRFLKFDLEIAEKSRRINPMPIKDLSRSIWRDSSMLPNWIADPSGYCILTACGAQEKAHEEYIDILETQHSTQEPKDKAADRHKQGVFSFHLLNTLARSGRGRLSQSDLTLQMSALLRMQKIPQHPTFYGNPHAFFFGDADYVVRGSNSYPVIKERNGEVRLLAGEAHGIFYGDSVVLQPVSFATNHSLQGQVDKVHALTSILKFTPSTESVDIKTGWRGSMMRDCAIEARSTWLAVDLELSSDVTQLLSERKTHRVLQAESGKPPFICISQHPNGQLDITNKETTQVISLESKSNHKDVVKQVVDLVEHLERYQASISLAPKTPDDGFCQTHIVRFKVPNSAWSKSCEKQVIRCGDVVAFQIRNKSTQNLYAHVYGWGPLYQVTNNVSGSYISVPPKDSDKGLPGFHAFQVQFELPLRQKQCRDTVKIIITSHPTDFQHLMMSALIFSGEAAPINTATSVTRGNGDVGPCAVAENWAVYDFIFDVVGDGRCRTISSS